MKISKKEIINVSTLSNFIFASCKTCVTLYLDPQSFRVFFIQITLRPKEEATFSVHISAPSTEGSYLGEVIFKTAYEVLT